MCPNCTLYIATQTDIGTAKIVGTVRDLIVLPYGISFSSFLILALLYMTNASSAPLSVKNNIIATYDNFVNCSVTITGAATLNTLQSYMKKATQSFHFSNIIISSGASIHLMM